MAVLVIIILTIIAFILIGVSRNPPRSSFDEFFLMGRSATSAQYTDTTVGYNLQVAVTVYFIFWGYKYGWSNLFFILSWCLGFIVFALAAPRLALELEKHETMFSLLARNNLVLRRVSTFFFLFSLIGLIYTELYFSSQFLANAASINTGDLSEAQRYWPFFFLLLFCSIAYAGLGGVRKIVITEKLQLIIAYLTLAGFFWLLRDNIAMHGSDRYYWTYTGIFAAYFLLAIGSPISSWFATPQKEKAFSLFPEEISKPTILSVWVCTIWMLVAIFVHPKFGGPSVGIFPKSIWSMLKDPYGWAPILGFGLANLIWQFSDYTAYHRLIILNVPDENQRVEVYRRSIAATAATSPITWALGIFTGMAIDASNLVKPGTSDVFTEFYQALVAQAKMGSISSEISIALLGMFFISVMLSTVDCAFISAAKMIVDDFFVKKASSASWRGWILLSFTIIIILIALIHVQLQADVFVLLNGIYSWGLIFGPVMLYRLFAHEFNPVIVIISLIIGASTGAFFSNNPLHVPDLVAYILPTVSAVATTSLVLIFGVLFCKKSKKPEALEEF